MTKTSALAGNAANTAPVPCVEVDHVTVAFDGRTVLQDINWTVPTGHLAAIIGPNGGGKSTLLRTIVGRVRPVRGQVRIFGQDVSRSRTALAYLPQNEEIDWGFPIRTIDVVLQGRLGRGGRWWRRAGKAEQQQALEALDRVRLRSEALRPIGDLSGGQRQRALLARALMQDASLILFDEPATGLDATAQHDLLDILKELRDEGRTVITTTHDLDCLTDGFDSVLCIRGEVVCQGHPREVLTSDNLLRIFGRHIPLVTTDGEVTIDHD